MTGGRTFLERKGEGEGDGGKGEDVKEQRASIRKTLECKMREQIWGGISMEIRKRLKKD